MLDRIYRFATLNLVLIAAAAWGAFLAAERPHGVAHIGFVSIFPIGYSIVVLSWSAIQAARRRTSLAYAVASLFVALSNLISIFATLYFVLGTARSAFNEPLTKLDALYFSVGTFTTAGTGRIAALGEGARGLQRLQEALGFVVAVIGVGFVLPRLLDRES